ncbi:MAG: gliding motility-associated C-terminal domain-containing protein [Candidatus Latescibacterota bacterium]
MGLRPRFALALLLAALLAWGPLAPSLQATELVVGAGRLRWDTMAESRWLVSVTRDSIWMWDVEANANVAAGTRARRGGTSRIVEGLMGPEYLYLSAADALCDGNPSTAFDPETVPDLPRTEPLILDLGGAFRVNRIRVYPRLDRLNRHRFLQEFTLTAGLALPSGASGTSTLLSGALLHYTAQDPNWEPVIDRQFPSREVRYLLLEPAANRPWEIAELELYSDGSVPVGEYQSAVITPPVSRPVWGRVRSDSGDIRDLPVVVRTRTGTEPEPLVYYVIAGDENVEVTRDEWEATPTDERRPPVDNPAWSPWEALEEGVVRSPAGRGYFQFRVELSGPGTILRQLIFEYVHPPIANELLAEVSPVVVAGGQQTEFTVSLEVHTRTSWTSRGSDTGFRQLEVRTPMEVHGVEWVRVDDQDAPYSVSVEPGRGFTVNLWQRVVQDGSFVQVAFRGSVFRDGTRVEVQAVDRRREGDRVETAYQLAREGDVEPATAGGSLIVRLQGAEEGVPLVQGLACPAVITPNGDGANDVFALSYALLKLVQPAPVSLGIYDLAGRLVAVPCRELQTLGDRTCQWDGRDASGHPVPPGIYLYELQVGTGPQAHRRAGLVGVAH